MRHMAEKLVPKEKEWSFEDIRREVEQTSSKLKLSDGGSKGCSLVARCALRAGDVVLAERPFFEGNVQAKHSEQVYSQAVLAKMNGKDGHPDGEAAPEDFQEDCLHPRSPLMDCVAAILLCKQQLVASQGGCDAKALLKLQKICALFQSPVQSTTDHREVDDLWGALKPELQKSTSREELGDILQILGGNRFGQGKRGIHLLFAGSMFEHSCLPNCFLGTWDSDSIDTLQTYRALRDIAEGEALTIDYMGFPQGYCAVSARAQAFQKWGFICSCPRCVELPEVERSFNCMACGAPDLCPRSPGSVELQCLSCDAVAEASYAARCFRKERELQPEPGSPASDTFRKMEESEADEENLLSHRHHLVVQALWEDVEQGLPNSAELPAFLSILEVLVESISKVCRLKEHPALLQLYNMAALSTADDLEAQKHYLQLEHGILRKFYPDEAERQEEEIERLVKCAPEPTEAGYPQALN